MKKTIFLPITIMSTCLLSCNPYKIINEADASKIAENIVEKRKSFDSYQKTVKIITNTKTTTKLNDLVTNEKIDVILEQKRIQEIDLEKNYSKDYLKVYEQTGKEISNHEITLYLVVKNYVGYYLIKNTKENIKTKNETSIEQIFTTNKQFLSTSNYISFQDEDFFSNFSKYVEKLKKKKEDAKTNNYTFDYSFSSNGDYNFLFKQNYKGKIGSDSGQLVDFEESSEEKYENCLKKYYKKTEKESGDYPYTYENETSFTYNEKISQDYINLKEYR